MCKNNSLMLKAAPPLVINAKQIEKFVSAVGDVVRTMNTSLIFRTSALGLGERVVNVRRRGTTNEHGRLPQVAVISSGGQNPKAQEPFR
jgi:hypothetical protein